MRAREEAFSINYFLKYRQSYRERASRTASWGGTVARAPSAARLPLPLALQPACPRRLSHRTGGRDVPSSLRSWPSSLSVKVGHAEAQGCGLSPGRPGLGGSPEASGPGAAMLTGRERPPCLPGTCGGLDPFPRLCRVPPAPALGGLPSPLPPSPGSVQPQGHSCSAPLPAH